MKRTIALSILFVLMFGAIPAGADEDKVNVDVDLSGYYRMRYDNIFDTGWAFDSDSDWTSLMDQRLQLNPVLTVNDKISVHMQFDILRNVLFGDNLTVTVPAVEVVRDEEDEDVLMDVDFSTFKLGTGNVFSQDTSNTGKDGSEVPSIEVTRAWGDVLLPFGRLRVGRQGSHFGMGLFSNDGNGTDDDFGDTYDRVAFLTKIGPVIPALAYDRVMEEEISSGWTDVHQIIGLLYYLSDEFKSGFYFVHRNQQSTDSRVFIYDLWIKALLGNFTLEGEGLIVQGSSVQIDHDTVAKLEEEGLPVGEGGGKIEVDAYLAAARMDYEADWWGAGLEYGFSSPSDPNPDREFDSDAAAQIALANEYLDQDPDSPKKQIDFINTVVNNQAAFGKKVYTFAFDKDYNMDLLLWEEIMGGSVKNGMYAIAGGHLKPFDWFKLETCVIKSWINESGKGQDGKDADHDLGWEWDTFLNFTMAKHFNLDFQFGYLWPGPWFEDNFDHVKNVFTFQTNFVINF